MEKRNIACDQRLPEDHNASVPVMSHLRSRDSQREPMLPYVDYNVFVVLSHIISL